MATMLIQMKRMTRYSTMGAERAWVLVYAFAIAPAAFASPFDADRIEVVLSDYLDLQPWAAERRVPTVDRRIAVPECALPLQARRSGRDPYAVELSCPVSPWRKSFRYPPLGAERRGVPASLSGEAGEAPREAAVTDAAPRPERAATITVYRARVPMRPGQAIAPQDVEAVAVAAASNRYAVTDVSLFANQVTASAISRGTVIANQMLQSAPVIRRGQTVSVSVSGLGFEISTEGVALEDAQSGALFRLQSSSNGEVLKVRAVSPGHGAIEKTP